MLQRLKEGALDFLRAAYWIVVDIRDFNPDFDMIVVVATTASSVATCVLAILASLCGR